MFFNYTICFLSPYNKLNYISIVPYNCSILLFLCYSLKYHMALMSAVNDIPREKGLDRQHYKCKGCARPIGMSKSSFEIVIILQ